VRHKKGTKLFFSISSIKVGRFAENFVGMFRQ
jgi:hypothetical protein